MTRAVTLAQAASGTVLQVVQASISTTLSTTSTSYVASGFSASITPSSASSKIFVLADIQAAVSGSQGVNSSGMYAVYRNGSLIGDAFNLRTYSYGTQGVYIAVPIPITLLDSPASTTAVTYAIYFKTGASTNTYINSEAPSSSYLTLMEIAG